MNSPDDAPPPQDVLAAVVPETVAHQGRGAEQPESFDFPQLVDARHSSMPPSCFGPLPVIIGAIILPQGKDRGRLFAVARSTNPTPDSWAQRACPPGITYWRSFCSHGIAASYETRGPPA